MVVFRHESPRARAGKRAGQYFAKDHSSQVNWVVLSDRLTGSRAPGTAFDLRLWLSGAVDSGEMFWLSVHKSLVPPTKRLWKSSFQAPFGLDTE